ncbi:MAG: DUF4147 domain-containing protein, partial [Paracoccaceae bacterium]
MPDSQTTELRALARAMFKAGVSAADPHKALARQFLSHPIRPLPAGGCFFIVALGKAAIAMAKTTLAHLPEGARFDALAVTNAENETSLAHCRVMRGGHPDPDNDSLKAADAIIEMMSRAGPGDHVIALLSGGGSALVCAPARGLGLADKLAINRLLLAEGLDIGETNLVRQHLSRLKG